MDQNLKEKTLEKLTAADNILIVASSQTEVDGLAAACGLYLSLTKLGKNVAILAKSPTVGDAQSLYGVDKVGQKPNSRNLVIVIDNAVNSVDKVTYFLEKDKLKVVVHPLPGAQTITTEQISVEKNSPNPDLILAVGFESSGQLEKEFSHEQNIDPNAWIIALNKNELEQKFAHAHVINPTATSYSELAAALVQELALPIDEDISFNFYKGILNATDNFSPGKSNPAVFQVAAWLVKFGAGKASLAANPSQEISSSPIPQAQSSPVQQTYQQPTGVDMIDSQKETEEDWFKPPKIYKGSKSFDT